MTPGEERSGTVAPISDQSDIEASRLRDRAVDRSLDSARARAEQRVQRFLDAASELIVEKGGLDFTVQEVVERSTQSLRSFYQFFDGKRHLLLAVYEESIRAAAVELEAGVADIDDPLERLHQMVVTTYEWSESSPAAGTPSPHLTVRGMAAFVFELLVTERDTVVTATVPLYQHFLEVMTTLQDEGRIKVDNVRTAAAFVVQTTMFNAFGSATDGDADARRARADAIWNHLYRGIAGQS